MALIDAVRILTIIETYSKQWNEILTNHYTRYILAEFHLSGETIFVLINDLNIETIVSEEFAQNTYIVHLQGSKNCFIIDAGFDVEQIIDYLKQNDLTPVAILVTHGHMDHIAGNDAIKEIWTKCKVYVGEGDSYKLIDPNGNLSAFFGVPLTVSPPDATLKDNDKITIAGIPIVIRHIPGHSKGHVVYMVKEQNQAIVFVGDVIFYDGIGRHDFADGNHNDLIDGIRDKILVLAGDTILLPGHGPQTTVERERRYNKFLHGDFC